MKRTSSYYYSYLARTSPEDVARLEDRTFICTPNERDAIPIPKKGVKSQLGYWMDPEKMEAELKEKFSRCMEGGLESNDDVTLIFSMFVCVMHP